MNMIWMIAAALALTMPLFLALPLRKGPGTPRFAGDGTEQKIVIYRRQMAKLREDTLAGRLDSNHYAQARDELENRLLDQLPDSSVATLMVPPRRTYRTAALAAGVAIPLAAILLYLALGNPAAVSPPQTDAAHGLGQQQVDAMISRLATRLDKNPQDAKGWIMLARAQAVLGRFDEASAAYAKSVALVPDDAQLLADYADALAMAQGQSLAGKPDLLVERALHADPDNAKALALAGTSAFEKKNFALAIKFWERLRSSVPARSEFAESAQRNINEAKGLEAHAARQPISDAPADSQASARR